MNISNHYQKAVVNIGDLNSNSDLKTSLRGLCLRALHPSPHHPAHLKINLPKFHNICCEICEGDPAVVRCTISSIGNF